MFHAAEGFSINNKTYHRSVLSNRSLLSEKTETYFFFMTNPIIQYKVDLTLNLVSIKGTHLQSCRSTYTHKYLFETILYMF